MAKPVHDPTIHTTDVETGSGSGSGMSPLLPADGSIHVLSDGTKPLDIMGVGAALSLRAKLVFLATNFAFLCDGNEPPRPHISAHALHLRLADEPVDRMLLPPI